MEKIQKHWLWLAEEMPAIQQMQRKMERLGIFWRLVYILKLMFTEVVPRDAQNKLFWEIS